MRYGEQETNWQYFIQSSFTLHSLHLELPRISLSVSLDCLLYYLLLRQSSITVHVWGSTHLLLFHDAIFIIRKASPEGRRPAYSFTVSLGKSQVEVCVIFSPRSIKNNSNMNPRLSGYISILGLVSLCPSLYWELWENGVVKNLQFLSMH